MVLNERENFWLVNKNRKGRLHSSSLVSDPPRTSLTFFLVLQLSEIDEVDSSPLRSRKDLITQQYKKKHHGAPIVPPLELYKLQQHDVADEIQLSPRERYERFGTDEALLSPRSRPLTIDTRTTGYECPPSPPHEQIEHSWFERRLVTDFNISWWMRDRKRTNIRIFSLVLSNTS